MASALDPEEFVVLASHGMMRLRSAVARAMALLPEERDAAIIVRKGEPSILDFERIKELAVSWERSERPALSEADIPLEDKALASQPPAP
jgi:hypothetical protein